MDMKDKERPTHVYLLAYRDIGPTKIGIAVSVVSRLAEIQTGNPYRLRVYKAWRVPNSECAYRLEQHVLALFVAQRLVGEWLQLPPKLLVGTVTRLAAEWNIPLLPWKPTKAEEALRKTQAEAERKRRVWKGLETLKRINAESAMRIGDKPRVEVTFFRDPVKRQLRRWE